MQIQQQTLGDVTVVTLSGDLDAATAPAVRERLDAVADGPQRRIVVDMGGVGFMSSAGLWVLQSSARLARSGGGDLRVAGVRGAVQQTLEQTGFTGLLRCFPTVAAAVADFHMAITDDTVGEVAVVRLEGDLDASVAPQVQEHIKGRIKKGEYRVIVDFSKVPFLASAGLRALQICSQAARALDGEIRLAGVQPAVKEVLDMSGFSALFRSYPTVEAAAQSFG